MSEQNQAEKKGGSKMIIFVAMGLLLLVNGFVVARVVMAPKEKAAKTEATEVEEVGPKLSLEEFLVNLGGSNEHYLKTTIAIGLKKDLTEEKVKEDIAPIRDAIVTVLSSKDLNEVATEAGKEKLKTELVERINKELGDKKVVKIYFQSFATQ